MTQYTPILYNIYSVCVCVYTYVHIHTYPRHKMNSLYC